MRSYFPSVRHKVPSLGILDLGNIRPTPPVLRDLIVGVGEDVRDGRYGNFTVIVAAANDATRDMVTWIAEANDLPLFVSRSPVELETAEPVGSITRNEQDTLRVLLLSGGTLSAADLAARLEIEETAAGNRLVNLHKKGYVQRIAQAHPKGDLFADARSVRWT
jgi:hypothetical protein